MSSNPYSTPTASSEEAESRVPLWLWAVAAILAVPLLVLVLGGGLLLGIVVRDRLHV